MKTVAIIQARMGSSRLPNKILMPVLGRPLLGWMLDRVSQCIEVSEVVIATTTNSQDDTIEQFAAKEGYRVVRGSELDVLDRYYQAAQESEAENIIRLTSDCPLLDPELLGEMIRLFHIKDVDFLSNSEPLPSSWPDGMDISIVKFKALQEAANNATLPSEREHVTFHFWNNPQLFTCEKVEHAPDWTKYRVTLDYLEDFELLKTLMEHFGAKDSSKILNLSAESIIKYLDDNPLVFALNAQYSHGIGWKSAFERDVQYQKKCSKIMTNICPICQSNSNTYFEYADFFKSHISISKCVNCGHGFHENHYSDEQFINMYKSQYASDYVELENESYKLRQLQYHLDTKLLLENEDLKSISVFDFGCSSGLYLRAMPETWFKTGFEVNPFHLSHIKQHYSEITVHSDLNEVEGTFDLITLRGVIEHISDHQGLISFIKKHLRPKGLVYISATPDFSSVCATLYKQTWSQLMCPEHIHQFTPASLCLLLANANLAMRSLHHPYLQTPYADWEKDKVLFLNNFSLSNVSGKPLEGKHAFCGNMMSAIFQSSQ